MTMSLKRRASVLYFHLPAQKIVKLPPCTRLQEDPTHLGNLNLVARIMKTALPDNAKIAKEAKECMQECVSEFISFITSEGKVWEDVSVHGHKQAWCGQVSSKTQT